MHAITSPPIIEPADRLGLTLFLAVAAHALVILGVTFVHEERSRSRTSTLDVVLVQHRSEKAPEQARHLAQANQEGGGESERPEQPATPLAAPLTVNRALVAAVAPARPPSDPVRAPPDPRAEPRPAEAAPARAAPRPVLAQRERPARQKVALRPEPEPEPRAKALAPPKPSRRPDPEARPRARPAPATPPAPAPTVRAAELVSRSLSMASLSAQIDQRLKAYAERPRRKWITARTREHKYAAYMDAWRAKVERIGNLNYPDQARRRHLSGSLLLDVALNADGSINEIVLRRSSGHKVLDDAAVRIVKLAAPFAKFPKGIAEEVDILHIERTWRFLSSNRFASR